MTLCPIKNDSFSLSLDFLTQIKTLFGSEIFIETGTFLGNTSALASEIFDEVYTVELSRELYNNAIARFKNKTTNIHLFNDNSPSFLSAVIPNITKTMTIFLDAHWSEGVTARGETNTPIIEELNIIKENRKSDCIILIDDIRCFKESIYDHKSSLSGYPSLESLIKKGKEMFDDLGFVVFGDIAIMYDANLHKIKISSVLDGITQYKITKSNSSTRLNDIINLYQKIGSASGSELDGIEWLAKLSKISPIDLSLDFLIWRSFTLINKNRCAQAKKIISPIIGEFHSNIDSQYINFILNTI